MKVARLWTGEKREADRKFPESLQALGGAAMYPRERARHGKNVRDQPPVAAKFVHDAAQKVIVQLRPGQQSLWVHDP